MSDDFNKLRPPDGDDDDWLDWQSDDADAEQPGTPSGDRLGFTGELSWRQDVEQAFNDQLDESGSDAFAWQRGQSPAESSSDAGDLDSQPPDWQGDAPGAETPQASDDAPDWLAAFTGDEPPPESEAAVELPPWLTQLPDDEAEPEASLPLSDVPAWLREDAEDTADQAAAEPLSGGDLPPWLAQLPADEAQVEADAPLSDVPAWLREDAEDTVDEPSLADELPPWLSGADTLTAADAPDIPGGDVPPWLAGMDEPPAEEDLFAGLDEALGIAPDSAAAGETPDWLGAFNEPVADDAPPSGLDAYLVDEVVDEDFFGELVENEATTPDWLNAAGVEPVEADEPLAGDLFSGWSSAPAGEAEAEPEADLFAGWNLTPADDDAEELPVLDSEDEAVEAPASDLFAGWEAARQTFDSDSDDAPTEAAAEATPDWLLAAAPLPDSPPPPAAPQDIFGELGLPTPETGFDFLDNPPAEAESPDWFAQEPAASATPGWLDDLGDFDLSSAAEDETPVPAPADFLMELRGAAEAADDDLSVPSFDDLDSLIASYETPAATPENRALLDTRMDDIDRLLSDDDLDQIAARRAPRVDADDILPETPDWLTESGVLVGGASAGAILRKQAERERPLEELDERLQALHDRGLDLLPPVESAPSADLKTLLPGVKEFIAPTPIKTGATGITSDVVLTPQQLDKIKLLRMLAPVEAAPQPTAPSALDQTYAAPSFADIIGDEDELEAAPEPTPQPTPRRAPRRVKLDRLLITVLVALGVLLPFYIGALRVGDLPPAQFAAASRQQAAFERVDTLAPGELVLIAAEYGPTGAAELDSLTEALLRHVLLKGARPVVVSTNVLGLLHVQNIVDRLAADAAFTGQINRPLAANRDFYVVRYLAGGVVGLRSFAHNVPALLATDVTGRATNLAPASLRDFALIVTIAERAEDLRAWAEQVAPLAGQPLVAAVGFSAAPLAEPYVLLGAPENQPGLRGLLVGYGDAYTYRAQLGAVGAVAPASIPTLLPTVIPPTAVPPTAISPAPAATITPATEVPGAADATAEATPEATGAATAEATAELAPGVTAEATAAALMVIGVIDADQTVNVREGPGRTFRSVAAVRPGQRVQIIGRSGNSEWLQIRLDDGREGWISAGLVQMEEPVTPTPDSASGVDPNAVVALMSDVDVIAFQATPSPAPAGQGEIVPEATADAAPLSDAVDAAAGAAVPYRDERWYGMTFGLIVIIAVITVGTVVNVIGSLFRRRGR